MSDTPKTNEFLGLIAEAGPEHYGVLNVDDPWPDYRKLVDFARILERENAALREADQFECKAYWLEEQRADDPSCAFYQNFGWGNQNDTVISWEFLARAVRRVPIEDIHRG